MAEFEIVRVRTVGQLHENLEKLLKNKKHIESLVVDRTTDEIRVDLSGMANAFGNPDFRIRLMRGSADKAKSLLDRIRSDGHVTRSQSDELFALIEKGP